MFLYIYISDICIYAHIDFDLAQMISCIVHLERQLVHLDDCFLGALFMWQYEQEMLLTLDLRMYINVIISEEAD